MEDLPPEIWAHILSFVEPSREGPLATVCKLWCEILRRQRQRRNMSQWRTWIGHYVNTLPWAIALGYRVTPQTIYILAKYARPAEIRAHWSEMRLDAQLLYDNALPTGNIELLETLHSRYPLKVTPTLIRHSAIFQWVRAKSDENLNRQLDNLEPQVCAQRGWLARLQELRRVHKVIFTDDVQRAALMGGHLPIIEYIYTQVPVWTVPINTELSVPNMVPILEWARLHGMAWQSDKFALVIVEHCPDNCLSALSYLHKHHCIHRYTAQYAIEYGRLPILKWLHENGYSLQGSGHLLKACQFGHWHIANWFLDIGLLADGACLRAAYADCQFDIIKRMRTAGVSWVRAETLWKLIACADVSFVKWAIRSGLPADLNVIIGAAHNRDPEVWQFLQKYELEYDPRTILMGIVLAGNREAIEYFLEHKAEWSSTTSKTIISYGSLHLLQRVHEMGLEWQVPEAADLLLARDRPATLHYALSLGCAMPQMAAVSQIISIPLLEALFQAGYQFTADTCKHARPQVLKWFLGQAVPYADLAEYAKLELVEVSSPIEEPEQVPSWVKCGFLHHGHETCFLDAPSVNHPQ